MGKISYVGVRHGDLGGERLLNSLSLYRQMRLREWNGRCKVGRVTRVGYEWTRWTG